MGMGDSEGSTASGTALYRINITDNEPKNTCFWKQLYTTIQDFPKMQFLATTLFRAIEEKDPNCLHLDLSYSFLISQ